MDSETIKDLIGLLQDKKPDVRQVASQYIAGITATTEGCNLISSLDGHLKLTKMVGDSYPIAKNAIVALTNMCEDSKALAEMTSDDLIEKLFENLLDKEYPLVDITLMLLANLSRTEIGAGGVLGLRKFGGKLKVCLHVYRLLNMLMKTKTLEQNKNVYLNTYNEKEEEDNYKYIFMILQNICILEEGRALICDINRDILQDLLLFLYHPIYTRRHGIISMLKNIAKDPNYRYIFLDKEYMEKYHIINRLLYILEGNIPFEGNDIWKVDSEVYESLGKKIREPNVELIHTILEIFTLLCEKRDGRDICRYQVYDELLKEESVDLIDELVNYLMGDEEDIENEVLMKKIYTERGVFSHTEQERQAIEHSIEIEEIASDDDDMPELE
ncbi:hypothetical protein WA158_006020 [Blastocystis sp. Blastoise]